MPSPSEVEKVYDLKLEDKGPPKSTGYTEPVILRAILNPSRPDKEVVFGDDLQDGAYNLSGMIGNDRGNFHWGGTGFQETSKNIQLLPGTHVLVAELQDINDNWHNRCIDLDKYIQLVQYVHPVKRVICSKLGERIPAVLKVCRLMQWMS
jgi:hypothetical protein